jgi:hypothetical protein
MRIDERAAALLALVEADLASRSREVLDPAQRQARETLAVARRAARSQVATAIAEERTMHAARVGTAEARLATKRRMMLQRRLKALVAEGWERMPAALAERWSRPAQRAEWVRAALAHARRVLPAGAWLVTGPESWSEAERAGARAALAAEGIEVTCTASPEVAAGIRVASRNVEVDATLAGLLAERGAIEGLLLARYEEAAP